MTYSRSPRTSLTTTCMLALLVTIAALVAAGCGGSDSSSSSTSSSDSKVDSVRSMLVASSKKLESSGTMSANFKMNMTVLDSEIKATGTILQDNAKKVASTKMKMDVPGAGPMEMEQVMNDTVIYMRSSAFGSNGWQSVNMKDLLAAGGTTSSQVTQQMYTDPRNTLAMLTERSSKVEKVGSEQVGGVETTHYRATIDPKTVADVALPENADEATRKTLLDMYDEDITVDVWIDSDDLPRTMQVAMSFAGQLEGSSMTMTMDSIEYDVPVEIVVPKASEATPLGMPTT